MKSLDEILTYVADKWGGYDCPRGESDGVLWFRGDEGYSLYKAWLPGSRFPVKEDSGRPSGSVRVPKGKVYVRCMTDAPDAWFAVSLDEIPVESDAEGEQSYDDLGCECELDWNCHLHSGRAFLPIERLNDDWTHTVNY